MKTYGKLREKIKEVFGDMETFAKAMDIHVATLSLKLNGKTPWTMPQIEKACSLLGLKIPNDLDYFFY